MTEWYKPDLAYIHDVGHRDYALKSAPAILAILAQHQLHKGLVVDLGCGSGLSAQVLVQAGYQVLGIDISEALIAIARTRVPAAEFRVESLFTAEFPTCQAVIAIGEVFNYLFDGNERLDAGTCRQALMQVCDRIYNALVPGGVLIFDIAEPGQVTAGTVTKNFTEGKDWLVLVEKQEDLAQAILTRRIITFRQIGEYYRRDDETHYLKLYQATDLAEALREIGFQVEITHSYGQFQLPSAHAALIACKPA